MDKMRKIIFFVLLLFISFWPVPLFAGDEKCLNDNCKYYADNDIEGEEEEYSIQDPLESLNRISFTFNDRLYFWILKPVAKGYSIIVPEDMRRSVRNFFNNLAFPVKVVNCVLQFKFKEAGNETLRFMLNSTFGILGMYDVAREEFGISVRDEEDFGQTLGVWGIKSGFYIHWPLLGPSSIRDTLGYIGDYFVDPTNFIRPRISRFAIKSYDKINRLSFKIGEYEKIKQEAFDPYLAIRDIYFQYRESRISR